MRGSQLRILASFASEATQFVPDVILPPFICCDPMLLRKRRVLTHVDLMSALKCRNPVQILVQAKSDNFAQPAFERSLWLTGMSLGENRNRLSVPAYRENLTAIADHSWPAAHCHRTSWDGPHTRGTGTDHRSEPPCAAGSSARNEPGTRECLSPHDVSNSVQVQAFGRSCIVLPSRPAR